MALRVAFLWHQHQPYYKHGHRHLLPWARLHATKDYYDMAAALERFPALRQTINVAPSLLVQLADYAHGGGTDRVLELSARPAHELDSDEKVAILRSFFLCNVERMINPYPRYAELYRMGGRNRDDIDGLRAAAEAFSANDWLDLQVWYNLTWIGEYSRGDEPFASLLARGRDFSEQDKHALLEAGRRIIASVVPTYRRLLESGQAELSVTPFYHPILPLLCDSFSALEAMPNAELPENHIAWPEDARVHVTRAVDLFAEYFGAGPKGMWPSEGGVSDAAMALAADAGFLWAATDEGILRRTLGEAWHPLAKYFPYRLKTRNGPLWMLFRDHELSDAIGFVYSSWKPEAAALDFYNRLVEIRARIVQTLGAAALADAIVPVILDGENCWEFYQANGRPFLEALYSLLAGSQEIVTTTFSGALAAATPDPARTLGRIYAGSWVGSNFRIWIGHEEDNNAWDALAAARAALLAARERLDDATFATAMEEIYIAEGSDWFWWYGDENTAADQDEFDSLFRAHLREVYRLIGAEAPPDLDRPIRRAARAPGIVAPSAPVTPSIDGYRTSAGEWTNAGQLLMESLGGAMHRADSFERRIWFGRDETFLYVRLDAGYQLHNGREVRIQLVAGRTLTLRFTSGTIGLDYRTDETGSASFGGVRAAAVDVLEAAIPIAQIAGPDGTLASIGIACEIVENGHPVERFPQSGEVHCPLV